MATYEKTITLKATEYRLVNDALNDPEAMGEDDTITFTAKFDNGYTMDIKCCGTQDDVAWTEAVLFDENGVQETYSEPDSSILGDWELDDRDGNTYRVKVEYDS